MYGMMLTVSPVSNEGVVRDTEGCQFCWLPRGRLMMLTASALFQEKVAPPVTSTVQSVEKSMPMP
jgi:Flp pilus assembly protein TadG